MTCDTCLICAHGRHSVSRDKTRAVRTGSLAVGLSRQNTSDVTRKAANKCRALALYCLIPPAPPAARGARRARDAEQRCACPGRVRRMVEPERPEEVVEEVQIIWQHAAGGRLVAGRSKLGLVAPPAPGNAMHALRTRSGSAIARASCSSCLRAARGPSRARAVLTHGGKR